MIKVGNVEIKQGQFPDGTLLMKYSTLTSMLSTPMLMLMRSIP